MTYEKSKEIINDLLAKGFIHNFTLCRWEHPDTGAYCNDESIEMEASGSGFFDILNSGNLPGIQTPIRGKRDRQQ